jgi:hypothetical protein
VIRTRDILLPKQKAAKSPTAQSNQRLSRRFFVPSTVAQELRKPQYDCFPCMNSYSCDKLTRFWMNYLETNAKANESSVERILAGRNRYVYALFLAVIVFGLFVRGSISRLMKSSAPAISAATAMQARRFGIPLRPTAPTNTPPQSPAPSAPAPQPREQSNSELHHASPAPQSPPDVPQELQQDLPNGVDLPFSPIRPMLKTNTFSGIQIQVSHIKVDRTSTYVELDFDNSNHMIPSLNPQHWPATYIIDADARVYRQTTTNPLSVISWSSLHTSFTADFVYERLKPNVQSFNFYFDCSSPGDFDCHNYRHIELAR